MKTGTTAPNYSVTHFFAMCICQVFYFLLLSVASNKKSSVITCQYSHNSIWLLCMSALTFYSVVFRSWMYGSWLVHPVWNFPSMERVSILERMPMIWKFHWRQRKACPNVVQKGRVDLKTLVTRHWERELESSFDCRCVLWLWTWSTLRCELWKSEAGVGLNSLSFPLLFWHTVSHNPGWPQIG